MSFQILFLNSVAFNEKDPLWMRQYLESQINRHNDLYQEYHSKRYHNPNDFIFLENVISEVSEMVFKKR